jgi:uncharacterized protein (DUF433 family)
MSAKNEALRLIGALPEGASWDDVAAALAPRAGAAGSAWPAQVRELRAAYEASPGDAAGPTHTEEAGSSEMGYSERITIQPGKRSGRPCVRGLRITVYDVLGYLAAGMSEDDILADFPDLERADVRACLAFAADQERRVVRVGA